MASLLDTSERTLFRRLADEARFDAAKRLLREDGMTIREITDRLGFSDPENFSRMFRRVGGLSPSQYRETIKS